MRRRDAVKALAITSVTPKLLFATPSFPKNSKSTLADETFSSDWQNWPDMQWVGPDYWGNRLQDWEIRDGRAICNVNGKNRALHALPCQLSEQKAGFETVVSAEMLRPITPERLTDGYLGFRIGAKGNFEDYRSAAVFGKGMDAGFDTNGKLFIGDSQGEVVVDTRQTVSLKLQAKPVGKTYTLTLTASDESESELATLTKEGVPPVSLQGNIALVSSFEPPEDGNTHPAAAFANWKISGEKVSYAKEHTFGPVCFAQYTLHNGTLKLTAQLAPVEQIEDHRISLQIEEDGQWKSLQERSLDYMGRTAQFRVENWPHREATSYRVVLELPLKDGNKAFTYEGSIAEEPLNADEVKVAVFSCNADHGFPDGEVAPNVNKHQPDLAVFLGDQYYEGSGGFGIQTSSVEKAALDFLHKWYMFGWSYREIFRNIPSAFIPDDHDVYHGNVWGEAGKLAPTDEGWGYVAQDQGGYKMPVTWVNMVQRTQTGHLPDPYDPTPVKRGINVYYTNWNYGGISFAILEDRKFKSAPKNVLPEEAQVTNGFIQNRDFDIKEYYDIEAELLGDRQMKFLNAWNRDWDQGVEMKAVLSQTNFCTVATLPEGSIIDSIVPSLPTPEKGEYVEGDAPTSDMDSNGWPQKGRDEALKAIRKCFALHIAGDQHLASTVQYGVEEFGDAGFAFAGPALNNLWPRRWWPPVPADHQPLFGKEKNTGNFHDGFGNKMTVHAVANPHKSYREPARIYDRGTGYGIVTFNKKDRTIEIGCWPRYVDPIASPKGQYDGWPIQVSQQENYGRKAAAYLDILEVEGTENPVVEVINEATGETEYSLRLSGKRFRPHVFEEGTYTVRLSVPEEAKSQTLSGLQAFADENEGSVRKVRI